MVALVTGASGFLGGHICKGLRADGWTVVAAGRPELEIPSPAFERRLQETSPSLVVHCAGPASVAASVEDPVADFLGSAGVLVALLERLAGIRRKPRLLLLSSAAVYGDPIRLPVREGDETRPISPYGFHRLACELLLGEFERVYGVPSAALRVFSAYGEGLRRQILWDICEKAIGDGEVVLSGTGDESRDFVHASDVAQAVAVAARHARFETEILNVASGVETTIADLAELLVSELGSNVPVRFLGDARPGDPSNWRADISAARTLGFRPAVTIAEGTRRYAAWSAGVLAGAHV